MPDSLAKPSGPSKPVKLVAFGNVAFGFIAIGNVAVGVVAVGLSLAVGPIAIGINSIGWLAALGVNAAGTITVALANGVGVGTYAGANGAGVFCEAGANAGQSLIIGVVAAALQCVAAMVIGLRLRSPMLPDVADKPVELAELVEGVCDKGRVEVTIGEVGPQHIEVSQRGCKASLTAPESVASEVNALALIDSDRRAIVHVRASLEPVDTVLGTDYRKAPETRRVLVAERVEAAPIRPPWWSRPHTIARMFFVSLLAGAAISAISVVARLRLP